ncbi:hypothetical protein BBOV_III004150 [Babesia bovis T2Bo]|uniref:Uncharacterized protein n=1 Tax=Babesia bovis TaxID=5865 RepID=A7AN44_BABBO|nr:hypothetical protein BBOV_III004150 [Babesia bovis T2Bo]EDO07978.1 hypothetical protein BBOV_III004150 [Babesia bovis T2Bo]|eukprot:XP_001611546.1 hypothetical protein [Babesia bovis T2Bo]
MIRYTIQQHSALCNALNEGIRTLGMICLDIGAHVRNLLTLPHSSVDDPERILQDEFGTIQDMLQNYATKRKFVFMAMLECYEGRSYRKDDLFAITHLNTGVYFMYSNMLQLHNETKSYIETSVIHSDILEPPLRNLAFLLNDISMPRNNHKVLKCIKPLDDANGNVLSTKSTLITLFNEFLVDAPTLQRMERYFESMKNVQFPFKPEKWIYLVDEYFNLKSAMEKIWL